MSAEKTIADILKKAQELELKLKKAAALENDADKIKEVQSILNDARNLEGVEDENV